MSLYCPDTMPKPELELEVIYFSALSVVKKKAVAILVESNPVHRGHAYMILKESGLGEYGPDFFIQVVGTYKIETGITLGNSNDHCFDISRKDALRKAHQMEHSDVFKHLSVTSGLQDNLSWACQILFDDGKWDRKIMPGIFDAFLHREARPFPCDPEKDREHQVLVKSHLMSAEEVKLYIESLDESYKYSDALFAQCYKLYDQGKWDSDLLVRSDFDISFAGTNGLDNEAANWTSENHKY